MSLENKIMTSMKESMKSKDQTSLRALRAIKSAIILQKTQKGSSEEISNDDELKILQKLIFIMRHKLNHNLCFIVIVFWK